MNSNQKASLLLKIRELIDNNTDPFEAVFADGDNVTLLDLNISYGISDYKIAEFLIDNLSDEYLEEWNRRLVKVVTFTYQKANGEKSIRVVEVHEETKDYILGKDMTKNELRKFLRKRIVSSIRLYED